MFISDYAGGFQTPYYDKNSANNPNYRNENNQDLLNKQKNSTIVKDIIPRETYGISILEIMSNTEYDKFEKLTEYVGVSNKYEFAKTIEEIASDYLKEEDVINEDETITKAINTDSITQEEVQKAYDSAGGMSEIFEQQLEEYITKIKSLIGGNYQDIVSFITDYSTSLKFSSIDLQA
jgi:hypothetical protein